MNPLGNNIYSYALPQATIGVVFNGGNGGSLQSIDVAGDLLQTDHLYQGQPNGNDKAGIKDLGLYCKQSAVDAVYDVDGGYEYFTLQGVRVYSPTSGIYLRRRGTKVEKVIIR